MNTQVFMFKFKFKNPSSTQVRQLYLTLLNSEQFWIHLYFLELIGSNVIFITWISLEESSLISTLPSLPACLHILQRYWNIWGQVYIMYLANAGGGWGNSIMVSVSVCQSGHPGSSPVGSVCFKKVELYQHAIDLSHQCCWLVQQRLFHVLLCLCDDECKKSLAICRKCRASCPVSRLLSVSM